MKENVGALVSGLLVGFGLAMSQMTDRERILGFLDFAGAWDPTLAFVLAGAVGTTLIAFRFILRRPTPLFTGAFHLPTRTDIDRPLVLGSVVFGVGWGIAGYCPGPAIGALSLGTLNPVIFLVALVAGSFSYRWLSTRQRRASSTLSPASS